MCELALGQCTHCALLFGCVEEKRLGHLVISETFWDCSNARQHAKDILLMHEQLPTMQTLGLLCSILVSDPMP